MLILLLLGIGILFVLWSTCDVAHNADEEADRLLMHLQNETDPTTVDRIQSKPVNRPISLSVSVS